MGKCLIFCAGELDTLLLPVNEDDYIIAADGGLRHTQRLGLTPHAVLGDFDSLGYVPQGATLFPVEKNDTDAMLAVRRGLELGYQEFLLYGSLDGKRLDHTVANFQTLQFLCDHKARGYLVGLTGLATVFSREQLVFPENAAGIVSLFCLGPDARGVTLENLKYPLSCGTLTSGFPLGVSNHFTGKSACISVAEGSLLALWDKTCGLPQRQPL